MAPVLVAQALHVRRVVPRLPPAVGTSEGAGGEGLHVVVVGDSVAAGVGVATGAETVAAGIASAAPGSSWSIRARSGLDAAGVTALLDDPAAADDLARADVVVVSVGVNDLVAGHGPQRWRTDLGRLLSRVRTAAPGARVVLLGMPPLGEFPALPRPLRSVLARRARAIDVVGAAVASASGVLHLPMPLAEGDGMFAADGFHPSAAAHALVAAAVVDLLGLAVRGEADAVR